MRSISGFIGPPVGRITFLCQWDNACWASGYHTGAHLGQSASSTALCPAIQIWPDAHGEAVLGLLEGL